MRLSRAISQRLTNFADTTAPSRHESTTTAIGSGKNPRTQRDMAHRAGQRHERHNHGTRADGNLQIIAEDERKHREHQDPAAAAGKAAHPADAAAEQHRRAVLRPDCSAAADASVPPVMGVTRNFTPRNTVVSMEI